MRANPTTNPSSEKKGNALYRPVAFAALTDAQLASIYNMAPIKKLGEGVSLVETESQQNCCYVVIGGSVRMVVGSANSARTIGRLGRGEWCGRVGGKERLPYAIVADDAATLMQISTAAFQQLPDNTQALINGSLSNLMLTACRVLSEGGNDEAKKLECVTIYAQEAVERRIELTKGFIGAYLNQIPKLPAYATELAMKLNDDRTTPQDVAESVKRDPSLAALVLQTVNSPYYGLRTKILDYYRACLLLGFNNIHRLVLDRSLQGIMPDTEESRQIHQHSYIVSVCAQQIAVSSGKVPGPIAATLGLLHDVGKSASLLLQGRNPKLASSFALLDASAFGSSLLADWGLPSAIVRVIELQGWSAYVPPERLPQEFANSIAALRLAHACCDLLTEESEKPEPVYTGEYLAALGFARSPLKDFYREKVYPGIVRDQKGLPEPIRKVLLARPDEHIE